jgi:hypothetical protein
MYIEMRVIMTLIYDYALEADDAETCTQSARHVTEGRFCQAISRAFSVVSPIVLQDKHVPAKRPLSTLLKLVSYVAEDAATGAMVCGANMHRQEAESSFCLAFD